MVLGGISMERGRPRSDANYSGDSNLY